MTSNFKVSSLFDTIFVTSEGNVGVNTSNPSNSLSVNGTLQVPNIIAPDGYNLDLSSSVVNVTSITSPGQYINVSGIGLSNILTLLSSNLTVPNAVMSNVTLSPGGVIAGDDAVATLSGLSIYS